MTFHEDRLIVALNKYWRPLDLDFYLNKMDTPMTNQAVEVSGFTKDVIDWIWEKKRQPFEVF